MIRLMIVDDEYSIRKGIRHYIDWSTWGIQLAGEAASAEEALDKAMQVQPDILLTDIRMGELDGISMAQRMKEMLPGLRVILLTGYDEVDYLKAALKIKVDEYLLKPAGAETIIEAVLKLKEEILRQRSQNQQAALRENLLDENIPVIQMHLIDNIIKGKYLDAGQVKAKAARLDIPLDGPLYQVLLVDTREPEEAYSSGRELTMNFWQFMQGMVQIVSEMNGVFMCESGAALLLILVNGATTGELADKTRQLADAILARRSTIGEMFVGVGTPADNIAGLGESFQHAGAALRLSAWHREKHVLYYAQAPEDAKADGECQKAEAETFTLLAAGRGTEAIDAFKRLFGCWRRAMYDFDKVVEACRRMLAVATHLRGEEEHPPLEEPDIGFQDAGELEGWMVERLEQLLSSKGSYQYSPLTRKSLDYLAEHYREDITLQSLSKKIFVSPNYLGRVFLGDTGRKLGDWLNRFRIDKAKALLRQTDMKTYEIAEAVGFSSYKYFSVCFLKYVGHSARDYRNGDG